MTEAFPLYVNVPTPSYREKRGNETGIEYLNRLTISFFKKHDNGYKSGKVSKQLAHQMNSETCALLSYVEYMGWKDWKGNPIPDVGAYERISIFTQKAVVLEETRLIAIRENLSGEYYLGADRISREEWHNYQDLKHAKETNKMFLNGYAIVEFIDENGKLFVFEEKL